MFSLFPLFLAAFPGAPAADAAPRTESVHLQLQSDVLSRSSLRVHEADVSRQAAGVGPGAGRTSLAGGYFLRPSSEVGVRLDLRQIRLDDDVVERQRSDLRLAATYTHWFRVDKQWRATATGALGLSRWEEDGRLQARGPFVAAGGGLHWFATPRASLSAGLEATHSLGGRFEQDGVEGSSRYSSAGIAAVGGLNVFLGGKMPRRKARRRR